jgi:hypothetical protein
LIGNRRACHYEFHQFALVGFELNFSNWQTNSIAESHAYVPKEPFALQAEVEPKKRSIVYEIDLSLIVPSQDCASREGPIIATGEHGFDTFKRWVI